MAADRQQWHPSERAEDEQPARDAAFVVPDASPGAHQLALHLSSHHGAIRLRSPVTRIAIAPYERASSMVMRGYLPALISAGALLIMVLVFGSIAPTRERADGRAFLMGAAILATGQLCAEVSRAFLEYPYPAQLLRILLVLIFATGFAIMLVAYVARRFGAARLWPILSVQLLVSAIIVILVPHFDQKTGLVLTTALAIGLLLAARAAARSTPGAGLVAAMLALGLILSLATPYTFLDRDLYLWTAGFFLLMFADQARRTRRMAPPLGMQPVPAAAPEAIALGTAAGRCFVLPSEIVRLAAADDYTEVFLAGARSVLHPEPMQKLLERLPANFVRVHRSHAVNLAHLRTFQKGRSSTILLADGSSAPVSRRCVPMLVAALEGARSQAAMS